MKNNILLGVKYNLLSMLIKTLVTIHQHIKNKDIVEKMAFNTDQTYDPKNINHHVFKSFNQDLFVNVIVDTTLTLNVGIIALLLFNFIF